jgi:Cupin domain
MSETSWNVAHLDEIEPIAEPDPGEYVWKPVRHRLGIDAFGVNAWVAREPGDRVIEEHAEDEHEELYLVVSGRATFTVDGETVDAPAGTLLHVRAPGVNRTASARSRARPCWPSARRRGSRSRCRGGSAAGSIGRRRTSDVEVHLHHLAIS